MWWILAFIALAVGIILTNDDYLDFLGWITSIMSLALIIIIRTGGIKESDITEEMTDKEYILISDNCDEYIFIGAILCVIIVSIYFLYKYRSVIFKSKEDRQYKKLQKKIKKLDDAIDNISHYRLNSTNREYLKILEKTRDKLNEQAVLIYIGKGIEIAKDIEINNPRIDIQHELDELEALQKLNKTGE